MAEPDFHRRLRAEIAGWQADGIISADQAAAIRQRYAGDAAVAADDDVGVDDAGDTAPGSAIGNRVISVIAVMGVSLIGLGIIAFIASNWSEIPHSARLALLIGGTLAIYAIGGALRYRWQYLRTGTAVILLGAIAYGAALHLIAQIYHLPVYHPNLMPAWFAGVIPLAYIVRSRAILTLALALLLASVGFRAQGWAQDAWGYDPGPHLALAYVTLGALLLTLGRLQSRYAPTRIFARIFDLTGLLTVAAVVYVLGFKAGNVFSDVPAYFWVNDLLTEYWAMIGVGWAAAIATTGYVVWKERGHHAAPARWEASAIAVIGLVTAAAFLGFAFGVAWLWWAFNLVMLAGIIAMIAAGYHWQRAWLINLAVALFAVALLTRYFEWGIQWGLLNQSLAFIVTGIVLLAGGFALEFLRRRMVRRVQSDNGVNPNNGINSGNGGNIGITANADADIDADGGTP